MHVIEGINVPSSRGVVSVVMRKDLVAIEVVEAVGVEVVDVKNGKIPSLNRKRGARKGYTKRLSS